MNTFIVTCSYAPSLDTEQVLTDWPIRHMIDHRWLDHLKITNLVRYNQLKMVTVRKMVFVNNQKNKIEDLERFEMQQAGMKGLKSLKSESPQRN